MNLLELQTRANLIVDKVNAYEAQLASTSINEADVLAQHKYADLFCLRPVLKLLLGDTVDKKTNRDLSNNTALSIYSSSAPMWNSKLTLDPKGNKPSKITDLESYQYYYGYYSDSPLCYVDGTNFIVPQNLHINTGKGEYTYTGSNRSYSFTGHSSENYRSHYILLSDTSSSSTDYWRFYNVFFQDTIPASTFTGETVAWFNTINNSWYRCTDGSITTDLSAKYCTLIAIVNYNSSTGAIKSCEVDQFKIQTPNPYFDYNFTSDQHEFMNSLDNYNINNLITLDQKQASLTSREDRIKQGINYAHSASIKDALVTESQLANVFLWNTTDKRNLKNNIQTTHRQVPGIVLYYLGNGYDNSYTATIGCNESDELNSVQYAHPVSYGSWYVNPTITSFGGVSTSQLPWLPEEGGSCCRIFIPGCSYTRGKLESPQQIWQPGRNSDDGIKYQGKAIYHELVFKNRRSGCTDYSLDFDPGDTSYPDNDPQGLATRLALSKQKEFYYNRPWFNELDHENKFDTSALADAIEEESLNKYQTYSLNSTNWTVPTARQNDFDPNTGTFYVAGFGESSNDSIKCVSNIALTNNDSDSTSPHTNYATFCFWIDPTTVITSTSTKNYDIFCQVNTSGQAGLFIRKLSSGDVNFGFTSGNDGTITAADWNKTKYCLCTISTYGVRLFSRLSCYDKNKQYITNLMQITEATYNYNSKALTCTFGSTNGYGNYYNPKLKIGITDLGIPLTDAGLDVPFIGKPGDLHEVILADSIDSYTSTIETTDHSDVQTDEEFYKNYRLNWDTYAKTYNQPR